MTKKSIEVEVLPEDDRASAFRYVIIWLEHILCLSDDIPYGIVETDMVGCSACTRAQ